MTRWFAKLGVSPLRIGVWFLLAFLTLELCARVDDRLSHGAPLFEPYDIERIYEFDELGRRGKPNAEYLKWKLNSVGLRGPDLEPGRFTVAVLGASETFGLYESEGGEYPRRLEEQLQSRFGPDVVQVVNFSYPGISLGASLIRLDEMMQAARPQIVAAYPSLANYIHTPNGPWRLGGPRERSLLSRLRIYGKLREMTKSLLPEAVETRLREFAIDRAVGDGPTLDRIPAENVELFRRDVLAFVDAVRSHGAEPVLITHATRFGDHIRPEERWLLTAWRRFYPLLEEPGFLDMERRLNDVMRQVAAQQGLLLIDAAQRMPSGPRYFAEFVHFTDEGAERMAEILADGLAPKVAKGLEDAPSSRLADGRAKQVR